MTGLFDPASAATWIAKGRTPEHAAILAEAWQDFPDLPSDWPLADRMARTRDRVAAMRPVMTAIAAEQERARQMRNFAFTEQRVLSGVADERERAILRGRNRYGYGWDACVHYAYGWYAAIAGWEGRAPRDSQVAERAYGQGFRDGGADPDDLFDAARRQLAAPDPSSVAICAVPVARPLPSSWPKPSDAPSPALWERRLLILGAREAGLLRDGEQTPDASFLEIVGQHPGADRMTIIIVAATGFLAVGSRADASPAEAPDVARLCADPGQRDRLARLLGGHDFADILVAAKGSCLAILDAHARALPLGRVMERTRNSERQQRAHFLTWMGRGLVPGEVRGAGHICWSKVSQGLAARLGEFTARYTGKVPGQGHRIAVELASGGLACGFVDGAGRSLNPETFVGNARQLRHAMTACLRRFGGATRLCAADHSGRKMSSFEQELRYGAP